jgi:signal transduction histidine kinase
MNLLKRFTDWVIVSTQISNQNFLNSYRRLLSIYVLTMTSIFSLSGTSLYLFFTRSLNQQLNRELLTLVQAAVPTLDTVKKQGRQSLAKDLPWRNLFSTRRQSLEWYNPNGQILARAGAIFSQLPLIRQISASSLDKGSPLFQQRGEIRTVTIAVYSARSRDKTLKLEGYIRASESTRELETTLNRLRWSLWLGGVTALLLISLSSIYLTRQAFQPTQQSFQQLKHFLTETSHELRNPLTKIGFATETLLAHPEHFKRVSDRQKITIIQNAAEQMNTMLENLLFLARTDAMFVNRLEQEKAVISLSQVLEPLTQHFQQVAQTKGINFQTRLLDGLSVKGDPFLLTRLFSNLLENAFKYTEAEGTISLSLEQSKGRAVISVRDSGIGIEAEYLPFIFQRFWRTERARRKEQEGLGLGLAIAQAIVKQHGGQITVDSQVGVGTCFRVDLPLA